MVRFAQSRLFLSVAGVCVAGTGAGRFKSTPRIRWFENNQRRMRGKEATAASPLGVDTKRRCQAVGCRCFALCAPTAAPLPPANGINRRLFLFRSEWWRLYCQPPPTAPVSAVASPVWWLWCCVRWPLLPPPFCTLCTRFFRKISLRHCVKMASAGAGAVSGHPVPLWAAETPPEGTASLTPLWVGRLHRPLQAPHAHSCAVFYIPSTRGTLMHTLVPSAASESPHSPRNGAAKPAPRPFPLPAGVVSGCFRTL